MDDSWIHICQQCGEMFVDGDKFVTHVVDSHPGIVKIVKGEYGKEEKREPDADTVVHT